MLDMNMPRISKTAFLMFVMATMLFATIALSSSSYAKEQKCYGAYGNEIECPVINKSFNIQKAVIKDGSLYEEVRGYSDGSVVDFDLTVKNTGELNSANVTIVDTLPSNLKFISLSKDSKNVKVKVEGNSISWTIKKFNAGDEIKYVLKAKVNTSNIKAGSEKCVTNIASIYYKDHREGSDTASVCIKKGQVLGKRTPKVLPDTANDLPEAVGMAIVLVIAGAFLFSASKLAEEKTN